MSLNCKLDRNISLSQPSDTGGTDGCNSQDITMGVGGISSPVLVYNIGDVPSLTFEGDNRSDYSLFVETINSTGQFYKVDHTDATYNEEYDTANHKWTHTLTLTVANIQPFFEDILSDAVNGKYLVCFRPNGAEDYRMFGWKYGATLDYSVNIQSDSHGYTITFTDESEYPLFTVDRDNFGSKTKVYTPIFRPLYDIYFCEQGTDGRHTGYLVAMYVVKVNSAGQPLDRNNQLCQWSNLKQDAYKIAGITSDGGFNIIGTYQKTATFDGKPVRIYDLEKCPANVTNSIFINSKKVEAINLNSVITGGSYTITSSDEWLMVSEPQYVTISPTEGGNGNTPSTFHHNGVGGCDKVEFMNKVTHEIVVLNTCVNIINIGKEYDFPNEVSSTVITPIVKGCDTGYTYTITPSVDSYKDDLGYIHINFPSTDEDLEYTLTTIHDCDSNEKKITKIYRQGVGKDPRWILDNNYCEMNGTTYTGYRVYKYKDINPNSPTYGTYKEEKERDASCNEESPNWQQTSTYCEIDSNGLYTGYYVYCLTDVNPKSPTAGQTREERQYDVSHCPKQDPTPHWIEDDSFSAYCETMWYEPAHVEGNTGYRISREKDDNRYSPTWGQKRDVRVLSELCPAPSTDPDIEEISYSCELEADSEGNLYMTGYKMTSGLDKNVYSPTYLEVTTARTYDAVLCPPNTPQPTPTGCSKFIVDGGEWGGVPASGDSTCDSAFLWTDGTPQFTPASASSWVDIQFVHWDEDPHTYQYFCTVYDDAPCVANDLMRDAGIVDNTISCSDVPTPTMADMPEIVRETITGNTKYSHALGTVRYNIAPNNEGVDRTCTIRWIVDSEECPSKDFTITQLGGSGPTPTGCTCDATGHKNPISSAVTTSRVDLGTYSTTCSGTWSATIKSGTDFLTDFSFSNGRISAKVSKNNTGATRTSVYTATIGNCSNDFTVVQAGGTTPTNTFKWRNDAHPTAYTATTAGDNTALDLIQISSVLNGTYPNAVLSSNDSWIVTNSPLYVNNNEIEPYEKSQVIKYIYFSQNDTGADRTGVVTLTQKGTSNTITLTIVQRKKTIECYPTSLALADTNVCRGGSLSYTYTMNNTACTEPVTFTLLDAGGHYYDSTSTPSGGSGSGTFSIPSTATTGQASVDLDTTHRYYVNINSCTSWNVTGTVQNNTSYIIQMATLEYYVGNDLRTVSFGGGISPSAYRNVIVPIAAEDNGKTWRPDKITVTTTSPVLIDCTAIFTANPSSATITDSFISFSIFLTDLSC